SGTGKPTLSHPGQPEGLHRERQHRDATPRWGSRPAGPELSQEGLIRRSAPRIARLESAFPARWGVNPNRLRGLGAEFHVGIKEALWASSSPRSTSATTAPSGCPTRLSCAAGSASASKSPAPS